MLKSRRGLLAAGLAVAVVGALGVASTLKAGAEQVPGDQDAASAPVTTTAAADDVALTPPPTLPWGSRPVRVRRGAAGMSSRALHNQGLAAASDPSSQSHEDFAPKGRSTRTNYVRSETTDVQPPLPAASSAAPDTTSTNVPPSPAVATSTSATPTAPITVPASTAPATTAPTTTAPVTNPGNGSTATSAAPTVLPSATASDASAGDSANRRVTFYYSVGSQAIEADGLYATMSIAKPYLAKGDYHSLAELALQSADSQQVIEVGWNVDRLVNGDDDPHLFVFHWVNGQQTCYNGCGFVPYKGASVNAGDTLPVDTSAKVGIQYSNGAWWIAYGTTWVGSFPDTLWSTQGVTFIKGGFLQVFGEVAAFGAKPCTAMGNGLDATDPNAAKFGSISFINSALPVSLFIRPTSDFYSTNPLSARTFRFGGPGGCNQPSSSPTPTDSTATTN